MTINTMPLIIINNLFLIKVTPPQAASLSLREANVLPKEPGDAQKREIGRVRSNSDGNTSIRGNPVVAISNYYSLALLSGCVLVKVS